MSSDSKTIKDHRLIFPPRISVEEDFFIDRTRALSEEYLTQNSNWAEFIYGTSHFDYSFENPDEFSDPEPQELITNYNLSQFDNDLKGQIDQQTIQQFIQRINISQEEMDFEFTPISQISKISKKRAIDVSIPPPLDMIDSRYLKISIDSLFIENNGQLNAIEEAQGVLFMYDHQEEVIASEPVYFNHAFGETTFDQTNQQVVYFECKKPNEVLSLVCILMNQAAYPLDDFISYLQKHSKNNDPRQIPKESPRMPIPFALSFVNISDSKLSQKSSTFDLQFPRYWIKFSSSEVLNLIGKANKIFDDNEINSAEENLDLPSIPPKQKSNAQPSNINFSNNPPQNSGSSSVNNSEDLEADLSSVIDSHNIVNSHPNINIDMHSSGSGFNSSNAQTGLETNSVSLQNHICIKCETSIDIIEGRDEMQKLEFCISSDAKRDSLPMLAESVPHSVGSIPTIISLRDLKLDFNSAKKADFVYFKAYFCEEEQADPQKPSFSGTGNFISKKHSEEYQNVFISSPVPYSKHVIFSDFVKIFIPNPLKYTTHIIIHIFLVLKGFHSLCRLVIIPLFENINNEQNNVQNNVANNIIMQNPLYNNPPTINIGPSIDAATSNNSTYSADNSNCNVNTNSSSNNDPLNGLPSFPKPSSIQSMTVTLPTINPSQIKAPDYLQKFKASSKTSLTLTIEIPSILYPPKVISDFAVADSPEKMNISDILDLDEKVIKDHFIPITAKFFTLMSPLTAEYFIKFYSKSISKNPYIKTQLRSWIYHNLDVTTIKANFLTAFTSSFEALIRQEINANEAGNNSDSENSNLLQMIINAIDIITDVFWVSCLRKTEESIPESVGNFFTQISQMIVYSVKQGSIKQQEYTDLSNSFGRLLFYFGSFSQKDSTTYRAVFNHLKLLLSISNPSYKADSLIAFFEFIIQFTFSTNLAHQMIIQMPVKPLTTVMFSPYQPLLSLLILAFYQSLQLDDLTLHFVSCNFLTSICMPLENANSTSMIYRSAYAFFPFLNIISNYYENYINEESRYELLPSILFLITYSPSQLLKNYFKTIGNEFQIRFINFMKKSAETLIKRIERETISSQTKEIDKEKVKSFYGIALFKDLTQRFIQFLTYNFSSLSYCIPSVISLLDLLINTPFQTPRNYPKLFDFTRLLIFSYPLNKSLIKCLLKVVTSPQHIARCFGTTLIALYSQSDFLNSKSVNKSAIEFLDIFTSSLLHVTPSKVKISIYKKMIMMIQRLINEYFKIEELKQNVSPRLTQAFQIIEIFEKLVNSQESAPDLCIIVMKIADANKNFPSVRMKWLKKIVIVNSRNGYYNAAFVAQVHICALISTVILNRDKIEFFNQNKNEKFSDDNEFDENDSLIDFGASIVKNLSQNPSSNSNVSQSSQNDQIPFNLIITRPFLRSGNYVLSETEFKFIPSVLVETTIDFDSLHPDFYILLPDFNLNLLKKNLKEAVRIGLKAKMYYDVRCILSILLRIAIFENDGETIGRISSFFKQTYIGALTVSSTPSGCSVSFYMKDNFIFCVDEGKPIEDGGIPVNRIDKDSGLTEKNHCFSIYRTRISEDDIDQISSQNKELENNDNAAIQLSFQMTQYTTTNALPRFTIKSEIIDAKTVTISLLSFAKMEEERYLNSIDQISSQFERCFPIINFNTPDKVSESQIKPNIEDDLGRIHSLVINVFDGKISLFNLLKLIAEKLSPSTALEMARKLRPKIEKLIQIYHTLVELLKKIEAKSRFNEAVNLVNSFTSAFQLPDIDTTCYNGGRNPLSSVNDYEVF